MIHDSLENWNLYFDSTPWRIVFEYLLSLNPDSPEVIRNPIVGDDIYSAVMSYPTRSPGESSLEAHKRYVDIQVSLENSEDIRWFPRSSLIPRTEYDAQKDRILYQDPGIEYARVSNYPGYFTVLFPTDAHMPQQMTDGVSRIVKKVVVKLRADLIGFTMLQG